METRSRAKKGGEYGVNGEFYEGGKFLPSTQLPKRSPVAVKKKQPRAVPQWQIDNAKECVVNMEKEIANMVENGEEPHWQYIAQFEEMKKIASM